MNTIDSPNKIPRDCLPRRFSEKDYAILLNLVISRAPSPSGTSATGSRLGERRRIRGVVAARELADKQLLANLCVSTGESEKADYAMFLLWQNLTHYLFRQGWSLGDLTTDLMQLKR